MNSFLKKQLAVLLSATMAFSTFATAGVLAADDLSEAVSEISYAYGYVDARYDGGAIGPASAKAMGATAANITDTGIDALYTDAFKAKFDGDAIAKNALISLFGKTAAIYYSTSPENLAQNVALVENDTSASNTAGYNLKYVLNKLGITVSDWGNFMLTTRKESQNLAQGVEKFVWAFGKLNGNTDELTTLYETMDNLQEKAMRVALADADYADIKTVLDELGWTPANIIKAYRSIAKYADPNNSAEFALIKAAARSGTEVYVDGTKMNVGTKGVNWGENVVKISPDFLPMTKSMYIEVINDRRATNVAGYYTSDTDKVTITPDEDNFELDITINAGEKGTADIIIKRDPYGNNTGSNEDWILRQKILIAYDIAKATNLEWVTDSDVVKLIWDEVTHATEYEVIIYKDGNEVARDVVQTEEYNDANSVFAGNGTGNYTAKVIAKGDIAEEVGPISDPSPAHSYTSDLPTPNKPVWTDKTLSWDAVTGATKYIVYFYRANSEEPFTSVEVDGTSYDATNKLVGENGEIFAAVKAKNDTLTSALSPKSDALDLTVRYQITGKVTLQSFNIDDAANQQIVRTDNTGTKVYILGKEATFYDVVEDADGSYIITGVPYKEDGYTLVFEHPTRPYLKKNKTVTFAGGNETIDTMLYFGDKSQLGSQQQINVFDLGSFIPLLGSTTSSMIYNENMDVDSDGVINANELMVVLRNYGKEPTDD